MKQELQSYNRNKNNARCLFGGRPSKGERYEREISEAHKCQEHYNHRALRCVQLSSGRGQGISPTVLDYLYCYYQLLLW